MSHRNALVILAVFFGTVLPPALFGGARNYAFDFSDPKSVVTAASRMLLNSDYSEMLVLTEMGEKRRTQETVNSVLSNGSLKSVLQKESDKILGFELLGLEYVTNDATNKMAVVFTRWLVKMETFIPKNPRNFVPLDPSKDPTRETASRTPARKDGATVYVDYLLKQYDGKWKIVSKRTR